MTRSSSSPAPPERQDRDGATVLVFRGPIDPSMRDFLFDAVREREAGGAVIVDLTDVPFLDSVAIGFLVSARNMSASRNHPFVICGLQSELREIFEITHLDRLFTIRPSSETALKELAGTDAPDG